MTYCGPSDVKTYLGITGTGDDGLIGSLCQRATEAIDRYTRRTFEAVTDTTRYYDAIGNHIRGRTLYLDTDCVSVTSVTNGDGNAISSSERTVWPRNETPFSAIRIKGTAGKYWTYDDDWEDAIVVTGRFAYSTSPPDDIIQAAIRWAAYMYRQKDSQVFDTTAIPDAGVITVPQGIPADVRMMLDPYVRQAVYW